jgi:hypothetical protein
MFAVIRPGCCTVAAHKERARQDSNLRPSLIFVVRLDALATVGGCSIFRFSKPHCSDQALFVVHCSLWRVGVKLVPEINPRVPHTSLLVTVVGACGSPLSGSGVRSKTTSPKRVSEVRTWERGLIARAVLRHLAPYPLGRATAQSATCWLRAA